MSIYCEGVEFQVRHQLYVLDLMRVTKLICRRGDSNPHGLPHTPLKRARLPVPPLRLGQVGCQNFGEVEHSIYRQRHHY